MEQSEAHTGSQIFGPRSRLFAICLWQVNL